MLVLHKPYDEEYGEFLSPVLFEIPDGIDPREEYVKLLEKEAEKLGAVFNPHWYNLMNHKNHHPHLTEQEYKDLEDAWGKVLEVNSVLNFLMRIGKRVEYIDC